MQPESPHRPTAPHQGLERGRALQLPHRPTCPTTYIGGGSGGGAGTGSIEAGAAPHLFGGQVLHFVDRIRSLADRTTDEAARAELASLATALTFADADQWLSVREAAELSGETESNVRKALDRGGLRKAKRGAHVIIARSDVLDWMTRPDRRTRAA